ncbi:MAG: hypothetical protein HKN44_09320 [Ilumatobacter sp.]|nr:hypothetical protein [Ilumatobacter sp.]
MNITLTVVAVAASVLGSGMALPQALRLFRTGRTDGVSPVWIGVSVAINAWWAAYAVAVSLWTLLPVAVVSLLLYVWIGVVFLRVTRAALLPVIGGAFGLGMTPLPALLVGGWTVAGVTVGLCYGIQLAPAVAAAYRAPTVDGISPATWAISFTEAALWLGYGVGIGDRALVAGGVMGIVMAGAIIFRLALPVVGSAVRLIRVGSAT